MIYAFIILLALHFSFMKYGAESIILQRSCSQFSRISLSQFKEFTKMHYSVDDSAGRFEINKSNNKNLILGSGSASRKSILANAGYSFDVIKADIDERSIGDRTQSKHAKDLVLALANAKADAILMTLPEQMKGRLLLTADQVVVCNDRILEKPSNEFEARQYIKDYGKYSCMTIGSIAITNTKTLQREIGVDSVLIYLDDIPNDIIDKLVQEGEIMHCAGGLMIEHNLIQPYIKKVDGSMDSIMGLSMELFDSLISKFK